MEGSLISSQGPSGFVSLVGKPNVGKSTLLNSILGEKVAIVSHKPQTTRNRILGVYTSSKGQIVFLDTPGIHQPLHKLNEYMVDVALGTLKEVDVIVLITDGTRGIIQEDQMALERVFSLGRDKPVVGVVNKTDLLKPEEKERRIQELQTQRPFTRVLALSALTGEGVDTLIDTLLSLLPIGPYFYPPDMITDQPEEFWIAEIIREKVYLFTHQEIPYSTAVVVEEIKEKKNILVVEAIIYVERTSQKGIIIGQKGQMLKKIGEAAREELERFLGIKVYLNLWVKVKEKWRKKEGALRELGYRRPPRVSS
ncbi:MAG TPA: GTPase Era [Thermosulfidibacter takaii]|uniref:GTPase Era n=1 Tax=Thermosulfidibacter takaii TaxID=412593 RepID=A0A7C0YDN1_9BACT|nr:GTPase Era [Thermosulfidibacter takaii]